MVRSLGGFFVVKSDCPICTGTGETEICTTDGGDCHLEPCTQCGGKGFTEKVQLGRLLIALGVIAVISLCIRFLF